MVFAPWRLQFPFLRCIGAVRQGIGESEYFQLTRTAALVWGTRRKKKVERANQLRYLRCETRSTVVEAIYPSSFTVIV
jgi:hypothetical protein